VKIFAWWMTISGRAGVCATVARLARTTMENRMFRDCLDSVKVDDGGRLYTGLVPSPHPFGRSRQDPVKARRIHER
jgi:hypothetical protein